MGSLPASSKRALQIGGIVAGVMLLGVLIAGGIASLRQPGRVDAVIVDSSTSTVSTTTAPAEEPEANVGPSAGEAREEATATTPVPEPNQGSAAPAGGSEQSEQTATKKPSSSGSTSRQNSATAGKCQPVGCNGGRGDNYTPDVDAPSGHHTVGSGPGGTAKTVPNQPGQVVDLNQ